MTTDQLHKLIAQGEGQRLEFKESVAELDRVIQTLTAFANTNTDGGCVLIGVGDRSKVKGVIIGQETIKQIADKISAHTDPVLYPEIEVVNPVRKLIHPVATSHGVFSNGVKESGDKGIIVITIDGSPNKPHLAFGRAYKRVGSTTTQMTRDEYERLLLVKHEDKFQFGSQVCEGATIDDIDEEKVRWFLRTAKIERGLAIEEKSSIAEVLMRLKLIQNGKLLNAAILFFGNCPQDSFLQSEAKCIHFKGTKVTGPMIDMNTIGGNLIKQVKEIERFIFNNIKMAAWIESGKIQRQEKWEYPPRAIREALVNALAHREYSTTSKTQVRIFDDRIEFWNPGTLPEGLTVEKLKQTHESKPKNPIIAKLFYLIGYVEEVGTGTNKIIEWCLDWNLPEADFEDTGSSFIVTFRESKLTDEYLNSLNLNKSQLRAIEYIKKHARITNREFQELCNISKPTATRELKILVQKNIIKQQGKGRNVFYMPK